MHSNSLLPNWKTYLIKDFKMKNLGDEVGSHVLRRFELSHKMGKGAYGTSSNASGAPRTDPKGGRLRLCPAPPHVTRPPSGQIKNGPPFRAGPCWPARNRAAQSLRFSVIRGIGAACLWWRKARHYTPLAASADLCAALVRRAGADNGVFINARENRVADMLARLGSRYAHSPVSRGE